MSKKQIIRDYEEFVTNCLGSFEVLKGVGVWNKKSDDNFIDWVYSVNGQELIEMPIKLSFNYKKYTIDDEGEKAYYTEIICEIYRNSYKFSLIIPTTEKGLNAFTEKLELQLERRSERVEQNV